MVNRRKTCLSWKQLRQGPCTKVTFRLSLYKMEGQAANCLSSEIFSSLTLPSTISPSWWNVSCFHSLYIFLWSNSFQFSCAFSKKSQKPRPRVCTWGLLSFSRHGANTRWPPPFVTFPPTSHSWFCRAISLSDHLASLDTPLHQQRVESTNEKCSVFILVDEIWQQLISDIKHQCKEVLFLSSGLFHWIIS